MSVPISSISHNLPVEAIRPAGDAGKAGTTGEFQNVLEAAIDHVEHFRNDASVQVGKFLSGETEELHTAALAVQKAEIAFDLGLQVRNKVVQAYQEIMRMQL
jgi:flagellar hook-basal body complex protein FliE